MVGADSAPGSTGHAGAVDAHHAVLLRGAVPVWMISRRARGDGVALGALARADVGLVIPNHDIILPGGISARSPNVADLWPRHSSSHHSMISTPMALSRAPDCWLQSCGLCAHGFVANLGVAFSLLRQESLGVLANILRFHR